MSGNRKVVAAIGAGRMGRGIAQVFAYGGYEAALVDFQYVYLEYESGLLDYTAIPLAAWRDTFQSPGGRIAVYWSRYKQDFDPGFVRWMEENIVNVR